MNVDCAANCCLWGFLPSFGPLELVVIGMVGILMFGNRLPGVMKSLGSSVIEFKKGLRGVEEDAAVIQRELSEGARAVRDAADLRRPV